MTLAELLERLDASGDHLPIGLSLFVAGSLCALEDGDDPLTPDHVLITDDGKLECDAAPSVEAVCDLLARLLRDPTSPVKATVVATTLHELGEHVRELKRAHQLGGDHDRLREYVELLMAAPTATDQEELVPTPANEYRRRRVLRGLVVTGLFAWLVAGIVFVVRWLAN